MERLKVFEFFFKFIKIFSIFLYEKFSDSCKYFRTIPCHFCLIITDCLKRNIEKEMRESMFEDEMIVFYLSENHFIRIVDSITPHSECPFSSFYRMKFMKYIYISTWSPPATQCILINIFSKYYIYRIRESTRE